VTGVKGAAAWFSVRTVVGTAVVAAIAPFTVRLKVAVPVALFASVTVTVNVVVARATVGVPVIWPVPEAIARPVGRAGETL
jgi:hypothetical protein